MERLPGGIDVDSHHPDPKIRNAVGLRPGEHEHRQIFGRRHVRRDGQVVYGAVAAQLDHLAVVDVAPFPGDQRIHRPREGLCHKDLGRVAGLVRGLVGNQIEAPVVGLLPGHIGIAGHPEIGG